MTRYCMQLYYVYVLSSLSHRLYVGVTRDLVRRVWQHRMHELPGFTRKYRVDRLVHHEQSTDARAAIAREKQIKSWSRRKKLELVEAGNPFWEDLAASWFGDDVQATREGR